MILISNILELGTKIKKRKKVIILKMKKMKKLINNKKIIILNKLFNKKANKNKIIQFLVLNQVLQELNLLFLL